MESRLLKVVILLCGMSVMTASISAVCPCFNRFYLYSIFYSEKATFDCPIFSGDFGDIDSREVSMISYYKEDIRHPSNYGKVSSHSLRCHLMIDNQAVTEEYTSYEEKRSCDKEIIKACYALKLRQAEWPDGH